MMNLSQTVLEERLSSRFKILQTYARNKTRFLYQAMLYTGEPMDDSGAVYVARGDALSDEPYISGSCAIVSVGAPPEVFCSDLYNCVVLEDTADPAQVLNELQRAFTMFDEWRERFHHALFLEKGIQAIIVEALGMFENPVYVHDKNYRIIAYAENSTASGMEYHYDFLNQGRLSVKTIQVLNKIPGFNKTFAATEPTYWKKTDTPVDRFSYLYNNLRINGEYSGRIFVDERVRPISKADFVVMDELTEVIEMILQRRNLFEDSRLRHFCKEMIRILENEFVDIPNLERELFDLGWNRKDPYFCFQIHLPEADTLFNAVISICDMVESNMRDCQAFPYKDDILVVVNRRCLGDRYQKFIDHIQSMMTDFNFRAGVSLIFQDLTCLQKYYEQTAVALKYGEKLFPDRYIYFFEDYAMEYLLEHSISEFSAEMLCPRALLMLINYDRENNTTYTETLRTYLECDSSPAKTIDRMFLHRSTLLYRLNRIQELIDMDLTDSRVKLHFLLAFQLLDLTDDCPA